jgi:predicted HTH domain antitoxin
MVQMTLEFPDGVLGALRKDAPSFGRELRLAAAAKWYEMRLVSQGRAAEIAGVSRAEFIDALARFGVTPFQGSAEELVEEATRV